MIYIIIDEDSCLFEIDIVNNEELQYYEVGFIIDSLRKKYNFTKTDYYYYDLSDDINNVASEIAEDLYKYNDGEFTFLIKITFQYIKEYYCDGYEHDLDYEYEIVRKDYLE